eukprot:CAMPEP_0184509564 /NCGR_PEP_ID=MMETSP0198_2-20121128/1353_1 /TAXON_ID=1112570 /ORGANISM="Thraustochytrium sp., Strain LLF1b" /LENGTH=470 /DNA_ID=CAMNT_0026899407 /DNA_START=150 /DNA_END=1562 /DNA_ORIENTATION=-
MVGGEVESDGQVLGWDGEIGENAQKDQGVRRRVESVSSQEESKRMLRHDSSGSSDPVREFSRNGIYELCFGSKLNLLTLLTPAAAFGSWYGLSDGSVFVLSLLAIAPFAERLGFVTEQLAMHTNDTLGGLLNATFGNATELIISLFALLKGRPNGVGDADHPELYLRVVQVSLLGSVLSNLLLVFGSALLVGGLRHKVQFYNKKGAAVNTVLLLLVSMVIATPLAIESTSTTKDSNMLLFSRLVSLIMFSLYGFFLWFQLRTHVHFYEEDSAAAFLHGERPDLPKISIKDSSQDLEDAVEKSEISACQSDEDEEDELVLGFWTAITLLAIVSVFISFLSEFLVNAIEGTTRVWGVPEEFIGAILLPVVGNAAEHASAIVFAYRNKMDIALGVALGSAAQIGVSVLPACVLLGWGIGSPLDLTFEAFEALSLIFSVLLVGVVVRDGMSHWLYGLVLICAYGILSIGFWFHE